MLPSANISKPVRTMRLGELVNSGLTQPSATAASQNARNTSIEMVPSSAFSCCLQNERGRRPARVRPALRRRNFGVGRGIHRC